MTESPFVLYRFFDSGDRLLYVGLTSNPARRFEKHRGEKLWWRDIARIELAHFESRDELAQAERAAIKNEKPLHNIRMNREANGNGSKPEKPIQGEIHGLVGRFFHTWRSPSADPEEDKYATLVNGKILMHQGHVIDQVEPGVYVVEFFSFWDGCPNGQQIALLPEMGSWTFYDSGLEMQVALGCAEAPDGRRCGAPPSYFTFGGPMCEWHAVYYSDEQKIIWKDGKPKSLGPSQQVSREEKLRRI